MRLFFTPALLAAAETTLYRQIVNAARFPGLLVAIARRALRLWRAGRLCHPYRRAVGRGGDGAGRL